MDKVKQWIKNPWVIGALLVLLWGGYQGYWIFQDYKRDFNIMRNYIAESPDYKAWADKRMGRKPANTATGPAAAPAASAPAPAAANGK